mmetsp:Transcript_9338/g.26054  ORF Transcript_9338/g.26054 Transcript_9338/m.26054 type:complete len:484 (+) Transcript_9338:318-1769(+)
MRPMACVSEASYSYWVVVSSGCTKMAWLAVVRLAPDALSSLDNRRSTLASPFLRSSFWNSSRAPVCWCTDPLSLSALMLASASTSPTCFIRSGNWTKTRMRSSSGVSLMRCTRWAILVPCTPHSSSSRVMPSSASADFFAFFTGDLTFSAARLVTRSVPRDWALMTELNLAGHSHPGTPHSVWAAYLLRQSRQPMWPQVDSKPLSDLGLPTSAPPLRLPPLAGAPDSAEHTRHGTSSVDTICCISRTLRKNRRDLTLPTSSSVSLRMELLGSLTCSRMPHLAPRSASPLFSFFASMGVKVVALATEWGVGAADPAPFRGLAMGVVSGVAAGVPFLPLAPLVSAAAISSAKGSTLLTIFQSVWLLSFLRSTSKWCSNPVISQVIFCWCWPAVPTILTVIHSPSCLAATWEAKPVENAFLTTLILTMESLLGMMIVSKSSSLAFLARLSVAAATISRIITEASASPTPSVSIWSSHRKNGWSSSR